MQNRHGRRGAVFSVRITDEDRAALQCAQATGGPRRLGPWLLWHALEAARSEPSSGTTGAASGRGTTAAIAPVLPELRSAGAGSTDVAVVPRPLTERLILDLCAGSGSWSAPYVRAGYRVVRVSLPEVDVRTFVPPSEPVWGILAAPPCDQFSLARNGHPDLPRDFVRGMECVNACLRIVLQCRPRWWALENPVGHLSKWLGTPRDVWDPCDFGDPWTKRTAIWGDFAIPRRGPFVRPLGGGPLCTVCDPERRRTTWCSDPGHRAVTPAGFSRAFFAAND